MKIYKNNNPGKLIKNIQNIGTKSHYKKQKQKQNINSIF